MYLRATLWYTFSGFPSASITAPMVLSVSGSKPSHWVGMGGGINREVGEGARAAGCRFCIPDGAGSLWLSRPSSLVEPHAARTNAAIKIPGAWRNLIRVVFISIWCSSIAHNRADILPPIPRLLQHQPV